MINKSSRFALIASLCAARSFSSHCAVPAYPLPHSTLGSRHTEPVLTRAERSRIAAELTAYRITRDLARPVSPYALAVVS